MALYLSFGHRREKTCLLVFTVNGGADHSVLLCSLISAFVIHLLENIISIYALSEISIFQLVSVAEQASLNLTVRKPKDRFSLVVDIIHLLSLWSDIWTKIIYTSINEQCPWL